VLYYLCWAAPNAGNTHGIARAPAPLGAGMAQGGLSDPSNYTVRPRIHLELGCIQNFFSNLDFRPKKSGCTNFRPELFLVFKISTGKFLGFSTFAPTFFEFFNFQPEFFLAFEISRPKKSFVFRSRCRFCITGFTPEM
jgi:hypothetical protein